MNMQQVNISENNFEQCIKCTVCTVYCPVVPVNPDYPGPKQAGPDGERLRLKRGEFYDESLKYCLNCKRCEVACPSGVKIESVCPFAPVTIIFPVPPYILVELSTVVSIPLPFRLSIRILSMSI